MSPCLYRPLWDNIEPGAPVLFNHWDSIELEVQVFTPTTLGQQEPDVPLLLRNILGQLATE